MIVKPYQKHSPRLDPTVRIAENAAVIGQVTCGAHVSIWYSVTLRGDTDTIAIGHGCNIQEGAVVHCDAGYPVHVGANCVIGHGAIVHGCEVGDGTLIGMGAILLSGCKIGRECIIGAGALIPGSMIIPDRSLVVGTPGKIIRTVTDEQAAAIPADCLEYYEMAKEELEPVLPFKAALL